MDNGPQLHVSEEYRKIADRLKKKMFRKIPYASVSDLFTKLSIDLQRTGQRHYSAQCMLSAAKCEELNRTPLHAAYFYLNAGRVFTHTSMSEKQIKYFTAEEFVTEAMDAFKNSIEIYETHEEYSMCATLCFELAQMLFILEKFEESGTYFMKSFAYASPTYNFLNPDVEMVDLQQQQQQQQQQQSQQQQQQQYQQRQQRQQQQQQQQSSSNSSSGSSISGTRLYSNMTWQERHHLLFSQNHATTQIQSLRNAVNAYLKTNDYEIVTQILQLQQTLLTQQYQTLISSLSTSSTSSISTTSATSTTTSSSSSAVGVDSDLLVGSHNNQSFRQRSGSITLMMQFNNNNNNNSKQPQFNSMATLLFTQRINIHVTLLLVLLIQKRKKESVECMEDLLTTLNTEYEQSNTTTFFKDNILPLIEELYDACINDRVTHVVFIVEQQILHHSFDDNQISLLDDLRHVYENPLFLA